MFQRWPKRDLNKHYYLVPNEVFNLGLSSHEIAVYNYLLRCEDRRTYQCHPSYRTIGRAVHLSENTVRKYVAGLEEKGLIRTEPSTITTKDGRVRNGSLLPQHLFPVLILPDFLLSVLNLGLQLLAGFLSRFRHGWSLLSACRHRKRTVDFLGCPL